MQNTGQVSEKKSYRVLLLLVVGLAAFSSAMKELNQIQAFAQDTTNLVAQWSEKRAPAEKTIRVETCENRQANIPAPPLPALPELPLTPPAPPLQAAGPDDVEAPEVSAPEVAPAPPATPRVPATPAPKARRALPAPHDSAQVRVLISTEDFLEKSLRDSLLTDPSLKALKLKNRRQILVTPDGKDVILKTLSRSINLRSAS